jgi:L-gulono-1,4-lactone dehydrogenase
MVGNGPIGSGTTPHLVDSGQGTRIPATAGTNGALRGQFVVLTGGSRGIGRVLAAELAARGASVLVGSRSPTDDLPHHDLDLASLSSVERFAASVLAMDRPIDLLVLNAGVHMPWREVTTRDGHELHWQVNYLSYFLLTQLLLERSRRSARKQIVYIGSEAHRQAAVPGGPLAGFWRRYAVSKEAATSYFLRLQELHPELRVQVISPGYVATDIHRHKGRLVATLERAASRVRSAEAAAREIMQVLGRPETAPVYWHRGEPATPSRRTRSLPAAEALWRESVDCLRPLLPNAVPCRTITNSTLTWSAFGPEVSRPADVAELASLVRRAADAGGQVRVVGQRHSYNDCFLSRTAMISVARLNRIRALDPDACTITCEPGVTINELCAYLDAHGFALQYCGNHGQQSLAGALATGTHGYGRDGGLLSELVTAVTVLGPDGPLVHTSAERDLRALRLALGTLGVLVEVTLAVKRSSPCVYHLAALPRQELVDRLDEMARAHEYLRFMENPFDAASMLCLTIDAAPDGSRCTQTVGYTGPPAGGAALLPAHLLRMPAIRTMLGRMFLAGVRELSVTVPFSTSLFVRDGVIHRPNRLEAMLRRVGLRAFNRNDWLNMELAIPRERFADFARLFEENLPRLSRFATSHPYYACRVVGAADNVLLGPNFERDVVFVDIHVDPRARTSNDFLRAVEAQSIDAVAARPHWGKVFFAGRDTIRSLYPAANIQHFLAAKQRFDPAGVFSSEYTSRVLGV